MPIDYFITQNDHGETINGTLLDATRAPVNLQGATVKFHMLPVRSGAAATVNAAAVNGQNGDGSDGSKGKVSYAWQAVDTAVPGLYVAEWQVTFASGVVQTFPNGSKIEIQVTQAAV